MPSKPTTRSSATKTPRSTYPRPSPIMTQAPSPPATPTSNVVLSTDQLQQLLQAVSNSNTTTIHKQPNLATPRIGGTASDIVWTGKGHGDLGIDPRSNLCARDFKYGGMKTYQAINHIEEKCKKGLQEKNTLIFGLSGEPNHDKGALSIRELHDLFKEVGLRVSS